MSRSNNRPSPIKPAPSDVTKGYQPRSTVQDGYKPSSQGAPSKPPSNPPNQGTSRKK